MTKKGTLMKKPKIVLFDIESSPNISYTWGVFEQNVIEVQKPWELLSYAFKELGSNKVTCVTRLDFKDKTDKSLTKSLWSMMNDADVLIAHNLLAFDLKKSNAKFLQHGFPPPKPSQTVDTLKVARKHFKLNSNRLNDLGKLLGVGQKVQTGGFQLWLDCMAGIKKAWDKMSKYNKQDVVLLEKVYLKLLPWINNHPNVAVELDGCPKCGNHSLQSRGTVTTKTQTYFRYMCNKCGGWTRSSKKIKGSKPANLVNL